MRPLILLIICLSWASAQAQTLSQGADQLAGQAVELAGLARPPGQELSWGQSLAADDLGRLQQACQAIQGLLNQDQSSDEESLERRDAAASNLQAAATRARTSLSISALSPEQQLRAAELIGRAGEFAQGLRRADQALRDQRTQARTAGPALGFGYGYGYGYPFWGTPYWGRVWRPYFGFGYGGRRCR